MELTNEYIVDWIRTRMAQKEFNNMGMLPGYGTFPGYAFDEPDVGFSRGDDPLYAFYKEHIDADFYRRPEEWLSAKYRHEVDPSEVSVISWVLPQTQDTRDKSRKEKSCPPLEWTMVRVFGELYNLRMAKALEQHLNELGYEAVAPMGAEGFTIANHEKFVQVSNWSERHAAYISGLGTFGLCDGLISAKGKAVRYGSLIVRAKLTPTERPYTSYREYCLADKGCRACIERCPAGAITEAGHDKKKCMEYKKTHITPINRDRYNYDGFGVCGLCQTGVPCESCIPGRKKADG